MNSFVHRIAIISGIWLVGILWCLLLPLISFSIGELKPRLIFADENALLVINEGFPAMESELMDLDWISPVTQDYKNNKTCNWYYNTQISDLTTKNNSLFIIGCFECRIIYGE